MKNQINGQNNISYRHALMTLCIFFTLLAHFEIVGVQLFLGATAVSNQNHICLPLKRRNKF